MKKYSGPKGVNKDKKKDRIDEEAVARYMKYGFAGLMVLVVAAVGLALFLTYSKPVVARVGGEKITVQEFNFFLEQQKSQMLYIAGIQEGTADEATFWESKLGGENAYEVAKTRAMESLRELKIQVIKAKEQGIKLEKADRDEIEANINSLIKNQYGNSRAQANEALMVQLGVKIDDLRKIYEEITLMQKLAQNEYRDMKVTEEDIETYYNKYPDWYKSGDFRASGEEAVWARHLLIKADSSMSEEDQEKAKKKAEELLQKIKGGEDFVKLTKENSEDTGSAEYGGDYVFSRDFMAKEFEEAAFNLNIGGVSDLVKTTHGYHIIRLEEKYAKDQPVSLKCAKEYREYGVSFIKTKIYQQKLEEWKKEARFALVKDQAAYESIKR